MLRATKPLAPLVVLVGPLLACKGKPPPSGPPAINVTSADLVEAYVRNEVAADSFYKGKRVRVTGNLQELKKGFGNSTYATLGSRDPLRLVQCDLEDEAVGAANAIGLHHKASFDCEVRGLMLNVQLEHCTVAPNPP